jgi:hypothetical protein
MNLRSLSAGRPDEIVSFLPCSEGSFDRTFVQRWLAWVEHPGK